MTPLLQSAFVQANGPDAVSKKRADSPLKLCGSRHNVNSRKLNFFCNTFAHFNPPALPFLPSSPENSLFRQRILRKSVSLSKS